MKLGDNKLREVSIENSINIANYLPPNLVSNRLFKFGRVILRSDVGNPRHKRIYTMKKDDVKMIKYI